MTLKAKITSAFLLPVLLAITPLAYASYGQFRITIPLWMYLLGIGVLILILTPIWKTVWLIGRQISSAELSFKDSHRLNFWSIVNIAYGAIYLLGAAMLIDIPLHVILTDTDFYRIIALPVIVTAGLGFAGRHIATRNLARYSKSTDAGIDAAGIGDELPRT